MLDNLKNANKIVGMKESLKAIEEDMVKCIYIASDAEEHVVRKIIEISESKQIEMIYIESKKQLGKACGINVGASVVCLIKT